MPATQRARRQQTQAHEFIAAVRYPDGTRDMFRILNANDLADARALVLLEVGDVQSVLIAKKH